MALDASPVQVKKIEGWIGKRAVPRVDLGDRVQLGAAVGEAPLSALAVTDRRLAGEILGRLQAGTKIIEQSR